MSYLDRDVFFKAPQQILLGFAGIILAGTFILMLPFVTRSGHSTNFFWTRSLLLLLRYALRA